MSFSLVMFWLCQKNLYEKFARSMLMKLTPGINFINVLQAAFTRADPESLKKTDNLTVFFLIWAPLIAGLTIRLTRQIA
jgi:hypothetical protein